MIDTKQMKYLQFLILLIRLLWLILIFGARLFFSSLKFSWKISLILFLIIWLTLGIIFSYYLQVKKTKAIQERSEVTNQLMHQKEALKKILVQQPTHRDTLINLAIISCQLEQWQDCQDYFQKAKEIDPNNPIFEQFSPFNLE
jgi:tetratricopeptide (TPR) repeat protein